MKAINLVIGTFLLLFVTACTSPYKVPEELRQNLSVFVVEDPEFDYSNSELQEIIKDIDERAITNQDKIREVLIFVHDNLRYSLTTLQYCYEETASSALRQKVADCVGFTKLTVALLRGLDVPATSVVGCATGKVTCSDIFTTVVPEKTRFPIKPLPADLKYRGGLHQWVIAWDGFKWVYLEPIVAGIYNPTCQDYLPYQYNPDAGKDRCEIDSDDFALNCRDWNG